MIKSGRMRWAGYVARMERRGIYTGFSWGKNRKKETTRKTYTWVGG
jgi:hypothetical protein